MKIAFDVSYIQTRRAGLGRHSLELLKALCAFDTENEYLLHGWSYSLDEKEILKWKGDRVRMKTVRLPGFVKRGYWNGMRFPFIETLIGKFDIFHSADPLLPPVRRARRIATVHDLAYKKFPQYFTRQVLSWDRHVARSLVNADAIVVPSESTRADIEELFHVHRERIKLVRLPVSSIFTPKIDLTADVDVKNRFHLDKPFVLFTGTVEPRKNIVRIIKVYEIVRHQSGLDIDLVIVGKRGWLYHDTFQAMYVSPFRQNIRCPEFVTDAELASLYRSAEMFIYPSLYEGFGFPILEAMASGTPVITSNSSSMKELAEGAAILVDPTNCEELANAIQLLFSDSELKRKYASSGIERAKQFTAREAAESVMQLYSSLGAA